MSPKHVELTTEDRQTLTTLTAEGKISGRKYKRALALLELERGKTYKAVGETLGVSAQTLSSLAKKYQQDRLDCLNEKPRAGRPVTIGGGARAKITALACSTPPEGYGRWSLRLLAERVVQLEYVEEISHAKVDQILKKRTEA